jgi:Tfp pilus assembly protein PilF
MDAQHQKITKPTTPRQPWWTFPISITREASGLRLHVAWARLIQMLFMAVVAAWLLAGVSLFGWVKYGRGFSEARIVDILLPQRWATYRVSRGNYYIKQAQQELKLQKWSDAIHHLRVGVAASPSNTEGRLILAQLFALFGRVELAQRTLVEGLPYDPNNTNYLKALFGFLLQYQEDDEIRRIAAQLLPSRPLINDRNQLIALASASSHFYRGNSDAAEALIKDYELLRTKDGRLLLARIAWERGQHNTALDQLRSYSAASPNDEDFYSQLAAFHRELGHDSEAETFAFLRELANPRSIAARIELLQAYQRTNNTSQLQRGIEAVMRDFAGDQNALQALGNFATSSGDPALAMRIYRHCAEHQLSTEPLALMVAEAHIVAREYRPALAFLSEFGEAHREWLQKSQGFVDGLQAVACFGLGQREDAELYLNHFLAQPNLRAEQLIAIANRLLALKERAPARRVLAQAVTTDLRNQTALTRLIDLDLEGGLPDELYANLRRLLAMRRPSPELLQSARSKLAGDRFLFIAGRDEMIDTIQTALDRAPAPLPDDR